MKPFGWMAAVGRRLWAILRLRCPRCLRAPVFKKGLTLNDPCPVCGLVFEREPGYFIGSLYVSYGLAVVLLVSFYYILVMLLPEWNPLVIALLAVLASIPFAPVLSCYARVIWLHFDRTAMPSDLTSHGTWLQARQRDESGRREANPHA